MNHALSDEQRHAIMGSAGVHEWEEIILPEGQQPLPAWIRGLHVNWMDGCRNSPHILILTKGNAHRWRDQRWRRESKDVWVTRHCDGRAKVHYHGGAVSLTPFIERRGWINRKYDQALQSTLDGEPYFDRTGCWPDQAGRPVMGGGIYETIRKLATIQQQGYAGRGFSIIMSAAEKDRALRGKEVVLRGPWHGGPLPGYVEVSTVETEDVAKSRSAPRRFWRHWTRLTACFGLILRDDTFIRIFAHYQPHLRLARVRYSHGWRIEPMKPDWFAPKTVMQETEWLCRMVERLAKAAMAERERIAS